VTKPLSPDSQSFALTAVAKNEAEKDAVRYFKEVCSRDGLEMRHELIKLIREDWVKRHPRPGNPQKQLFQFDECHEEIMCDMPDCGNKAVYRVETIFPVNPMKRLCQHCTSLFERNRELVSKRRL
jgi:hypothetical protein